VAAGAGVSQSDTQLRWDLLEAQPPSGERLTVRRALAGRHPDVLIAVDAAQQRHVLVELPEGELGELAERTSRGIAVQTVELRPSVESAKRFIEVVCLEPEGHSALDTIAVELIEALEAGVSIGRVRLVQNVLAKWRRFWSGIAQGMLSKEKQLGLFGELWFLNRWLVPALGVQAAVTMWRGPAGARNDFEAPGLAIEVKTTGRVDGAHVIHGLDQLLEPPGGKLMLFSLLVRDEASGTESLPAQVAEARGLIAKDYALQSRFDALIYAAGYDDHLAVEYAKLVLRIRDTGLYRVAEGFPRLVPASFVSGVPVGVGAVEYQLHLDAAGAWLLAATPAAAAPHLPKSAT
jgi:hypothetical protein